MPRAPKHCGVNGCVRIVPAGQRCEQHQHRWGKGNPRTSTTEHRAWRASVLKRDAGRCQLQYPGICTYRATIADHIQAIGLGGAPYDLANGQAACRPCSDRKSSREGHQAQGHRPRP
jgi:5-methylcytosine-specific restriction endonuclease McrA